MDQFKKPPTQKPMQRPEAPLKQAYTSSRPNKQFGWQKVLAVSAIIAIVAAALFGFWYVNNKKSTTLVGVDSSRYQAMFLNNGQVYFGKLSQADENTVRLQDIYYLHITQQVQPESAQPAEASTEPPQLIKLGEELHKPDDEMFIDRSQVSFWENIKDDGKVAEAIREYSKK